MKQIIDISYYQDPSNIDYDLLLSQVDGVIIRLGYGVGTKDWIGKPDPAFERHYQECKARGVPVGTYHFMVEYKSVDEQLAIVKQALDGKQFELGFWADVELENGAAALTRKTVIEYMNKAQEQIDDVGIYTGAWCWNPIMGSDNPYGHLRLWVGSYTSSPYMPYGWKDWWMWQYTSSGRLDGYASNLDLNRITDENWQAWIGGSVNDEPLFKAMCIALALNVRTGPGMTYDRISLLREGDVVTVYEVVGNWFRIGKDRWCSGYPAYMERIEIDPPQPPMTLEERVADNTRRIEALEARL